MKMKTGYSDINITRDFKTNLSSSVFIEKLFRVIQKNDYDILELVDASTIYFENDLGIFRNRWDTFNGAWFGKIIVLPNEGGIRVKYQISVLPYRISALVSLLFGCVMPIILLLFVNGTQLLVCLPIPIIVFFGAVLVYGVGIAFLIGRLETLILRIIKDSNPI